MTNSPTRTAPAAALRLPPVPYASRAAVLVADIDADPWGSVRASVYETARVLSSAPWLPGHEQRITWLLKQQSRQGRWGEGPAPYRLLPTLSAVEALLSTLRYDTTPGQGRGQIADAAAAGLAALRALPPTGPWPDTAAIEVLVPSLTDQINEHLNQDAIGTLGKLTPWYRGQRLSVPKGFMGGRHEQIAQRCRTAGRVPVKFHHTYEGISAHMPHTGVPSPEGLLGSSPAATAAWAAAEPASRVRRDHAAAELTAAARRYGGLFPEAAPFTVVERLWAAAALAGPGLPRAALATVRAWAKQIHDPAGVRGAPGLMPDADDTAMAVLVAALAGQPRDPAALSAFEAETRYDCYVGEDTGSVTANAHALHALGSYLRHRPADTAAHQPRMSATREWLLAQQRSDGAWTDKWHASPYYATQRCVSALAHYGGPRALSALRAAANWVVATQHKDGSWGIWGGTAEETAYAVRILLRAPARRGQPQGAHALDRAEVSLRAASRSEHRRPALWHDKTLYAPHAIVQAEVLAALEMLRARHR